ncbi:hypothetical protein BN439_2406 [Erwinia amylovora Ea644]|nr:hypothetical protein BN439_2406 [Erwinia amylovora Ea644]
MTWYFKDRPAPEEFQPTINNKAYKDKHCDGGYIIEA